MTHVLAIDQGTSATKAIVFSPEFEVLGEADVSISPHTMSDGAVEQDPEELWRSVVEAARLAIRRAGVKIDAIGLANQGETVLAWDRASGDPLSTALGWQDRRSVSVCEELGADTAAGLAELTGLRLDPYFAAPKMRWIRQHLTGRGVVTMTDTWLLSRLCGAFVTDAASASRTLLLDLDKGAWSAEACSSFQIDPSDLPTIVDCAGTIGETREFGSVIPVSGVAVDQQAALYGQRCWTRGDAKCTYGTGAFLVTTVGDTARRSEVLTSCVAWRLAGATTYCLEGQVYTVGAVLDWLRKMELVFSFAEFDSIVEALPAASPRGPVFVPALSGLAAPFWAPGARGAFVGLSLGTTRAELLRSVIEGIAAQVTWLGLATAQDMGMPLTTLQVDGGLTRSRTLMQAQADLLQVPIEVYPSTSASAFGVGAFARIGVDSSVDMTTVPPLWEPTTRYEPRISPTEATERLERWRGVAEATARLDV